MIMKQNIILIYLAAILLVSCSKNNYIIGGTVSKTNKVNETTFQFLQSFDATKETAHLIERAGLADEVNKEVTIVAPNNYAVNRYLRRVNNQRLRLDPKSAPYTMDSIPVETLQQLKMYIVDGKYWSANIPKDGIILPTHEPGDTIMLYVAESNSEPGAAWDGSGVPGWGYQYSNFMQTKPQKVYVHFKRGANWEMSPQDRLSLGYDDPECDQVYEMYLSDVITTTGIVHVIYSGDYDYSDHYYYHTLFFYGTRADDLL